MANLTCTATADFYWGDDTKVTGGTFAGLVWDNTVTNNTGFICYIDPSVRTPTGFDIGVRLISTSKFSSFIAINADGATALKHYGPTGTSKFLDIEAGCIFETQGGFTEIYTGDGLEDQTTDGWVSEAGFDAKDCPACIEVETGEDTGIYEQWACSGNGLLSDCGVGAMPGIYSYNDSTGVITFGNGGKPQALSANANSGQAVISVSDASDYAANDYIHILTANGATRETLEIQSISSNDITCKTNLVNSYTTAAGSFIRLTKGGKVVLDGAKVRVYNILIGAKNSGGTIEVNSTATNNYQLGNTGYGGIFRLSKTYLTGCLCEMTGSSIIEINKVGCLIGVNPSTIYSASYIEFVICGNKYLTTERMNISSDNSNIGNFYFEKCFLLTVDATNINPAIPNSNYIDCIFQIIKRTTSSRMNINGADDANCYYENCTIIGGRIYIGNNTLLKDCIYSDSSTAIPAFAVTETPISARNRMNAVLDNFSIHPDGTTSNYAYTIRGFSKIINTTLNTRATTAVLTPSIGIKTEIIRCSLKCAGTYAINIASPAIYNMILRNVTFGGTYGVKQMANQLPSNSVFQGCEQISGSGIDYTPGTAIDSCFYDGPVGDTSGIMGLFFVPQSEGSTFYTLSDEDDIKFDYNGKMYIPGNAGWIEWEVPYVIHGITAFTPSGTINKGGSNYANFTYQYKIDLLDGNGYSDYRDLTAANLDDHTIDHEKGFKFKWKISRTGANETGNLTDYINLLNVATTVDYVNHKYALDYITITLQNVKDGSRYWIYNETTATVLASGEQDGTDDIEITGIPYNDADETLLIRVRKSGDEPDYAPFETNTTLTENGAIIWISQIVDNLQT